ncbi:MAG: hypothetical protein AMXMBFR7_11930 [Planctomycetota bacterium]
MVIHWLPAALQDACEARDWYLGQDTKLAAQFPHELDACVLEAAATPNSFPKVEGPIRKQRLRKFSRYGVYYYPTREHLVVVSVFHGMRDPVELHKRLGKASRKRTRRARNTP